MVVADFSKAEPSRKFRNEYLEKYDRIIACVMKQREGFVSDHDQVEIYRKDRASIIEDVVKMLKELEIKPSKPLGKFDHQGLINELTRLINENPDKDTEELEIAVIKIKNRYRDITNVSKRLETYARRIDNYPDEGYEANMEADYKDEMVIDLTAVKSRRLQETQKEKIENIIEFPSYDEVRLVETQPENLERVVETHDASQEILDSLAEIINGNREKPIELDEIELADLDVPIASTYESEDYVGEIATLAEELKADLNNLDETNIISFLSGSEEQEDYATFTISNNISLQDLVKHVYEENDDQDYDSELWTSVYNFSTNKKVIDEVADRLEASVEEVVKTPGMLNGITLRFPTELVTYEQVATEGTMRRAA